MLNALKYFLLISFLYSFCPQIIDSQVFYEDDCGDCWMAYCYDFNAHIPSYDSNEENCINNGMIWITPGDQGDPYFNTFCDGCPEGFYEDDCSDCWMPYCYNLSVHIPYYDITETECDSAGLIWVVPGENAGDPYWNSSCNEVECPDEEIADCAGNCGGDSMLDDCGICQSSYCYDYVAHQISYDFPCDGDSEMYVVSNSSSNPYWNATCTDCNEEVNGNSIIDDCGVCQSPYCYNYITHEISYDFPCDGFSQIEVAPNSEDNPYWNSSCADCQLMGDANLDGNVNVIDVVSIVDAILNYTTDEVLGCGDINADTEVNITDVVALVNMILS